MAGVEWVLGIRVSILYYDEIGAGGGRGEGGFDYVVRAAVDVLSVVEGLGEAGAVVLQDLSIGIAQAIGDMGYRVTPALPGDDDYVEVTLGLDIGVAGGNRGFLAV